MPDDTTTFAREAASRERVVGQRDRVDLGERAVVDVARHDHEVDLLGLHDLQEVIGVRALMGEHPLAVERPAKVPVGGVQDAHRTNLDSTTDSRGHHTP